MVKQAKLDPTLPQTTTIHTTVNMAVTKRQPVVSAKLTASVTTTVVEVTSVRVQSSAPTTSEGFVVTRSIVMQVTPTRLTV